jgi:hypothetical protein
LCHFPQKYQIFSKPAIQIFFYFWKNNVWCIFVQLVTLLIPVVQQILWVSKHLNSWSAGAPVVEGSKPLVCDHSSPHRVGSSPGRGENFHVGRSSSWPAVRRWFYPYMRIRVCGGSSSTSKSWKSPYDPEGVGATENPKNKQYIYKLGWGVYKIIWINTIIQLQASFEIQ